MAPKNPQDMTDEEIQSEIDELRTARRNEQDFGRYSLTLTEDQSRMLDRQCDLHRELNSRKQKEKTL